MALGNFVLCNNVGYAATSDWDTYVAPTNLLSLSSITKGRGARNRYSDGDVLGNGGIATESDVLNYQSENVSGTMPMYSGGYEPILCSGIGTYTSSVLDVTAIKHKFVFDKCMAVLDKRMLSLSWEESTYHKGCNVIVNSVSFKNSESSGGQVEFGAIADGVSVETISMGGLDTHNKGPLYSMKDLNVYLNDQDGADFTSGDIIKVSDYTVTISNGAAATAQESGSAKMPSPEKLEAPVMTVSLQFRKSSSATVQYLADFESQKKFKMKMVFQSNLIIPGSTTNYSTTLYFPKLSVMEAPEVDSSSPLPVTVNFSIMQGSAIGMEESVFYMEQVNENPEFTDFI